MNDQIKKQIELLNHEQERVKTFLNENGFDCTTAPWVIVKQYRDALKEHIKVLNMNLDQHPHYPYTPTPCKSAHSDSE